MLIIEFLTIFIIQYAFFKTMSVIEKVNISNQPIYGKIVEHNSYLSFKVFRIIIMTIGSIEFVTILDSKTNFLILATLAIVIGMLLRVGAIRSLGGYWSYKIELKRNQIVVSDGIYKFMRHPAYIGNIYIPAFYILFSLYCAAFIAAIYLVCFFVYRARIENRLLARCQEAL